MTTLVVVDIVEEDGDDEDDDEDEDEEAGEVVISPPEAAAIVSLGSIETTYAWGSRTAYSVRSNCATAKRFRLLCPCPLRTSEIVNGTARNRVDVPDSIGDGDIGGVPPCPVVRGGVIDLVAGI